MKKKVMVLAGIIVLSMFLFAKPIIDENKESSPRNAGYWNIDRIFINSNDDWEALANTYDWCSGSGAIDDPYIIENVTVNDGISIGDSSVYFVIRNSSVNGGISIRDSSVYFVIRNCSVYEGGYYGKGIKLNNVTNSMIFNNTAYNNYYGIYLTDSNNNTLLDNTAYNNNYGIYLTNSNNNTLLNNTAYSNYYGIYVVHSSTNMISGNTANDNKYSGIQLHYSYNNTVRDNTVNFNDYTAGIFLDVSYNNTVRDNTVNFNANTGIFLDDSYNNTIELNNVKNNYGDGISLWESNNNDILRNEANDNDRYGIYLFGYMSGICNNNNVSENTVNSNDGYSGIYLDDTHYNTISGNTANDNSGHGIRLSGSDYNTILGNTIMDNNEYGVLGYISENNLIYNNTFIGNIFGNAVDDSPNINYWDNGTIGNYWADYEGFDNDGDGIGDTPYSIDGTAGAIDNYPIWDVPEPEPEFPTSFTLTSNADTPDTDGILTLYWTNSEYANNYSLYQNDVLLVSGLTELYCSMKIHSNGSYSFKVIAFNNYGYTSSNEIIVDIEIPVEPETTQDLIPSFNPLIIVGLIVGISSILAIGIKKRMLLRTEL